MKINLAVFAAYFVAGFYAVPPAVALQVSSVPTVAPANDDDSRTAIQPAVVEFWIGAVTNRFSDDQTQHLGVQRALSESPAAEAQMLPGDLIVQYGKLTVKDHLDLVAAIQTHGLTPTPVAINRNGQPMVLTLNAKAKPTNYTAQVLADQAQAQQAQAQQAQAQQGSQIAQTQVNSANVLASINNATQTPNPAGAEIGQNETQPTLEASDAVEVWGTAANKNQDAQPVAVQEKDAQPLQEKKVIDRLEKVRSKALATHKEALKRSEQAIAETRAAAEAARQQASSAAEAARANRQPVQADDKTPENSLKKTLAVAAKAKAEKNKAAAERAQANAQRMAMQAQRAAQAVKNESGTVQPTPPTAVEDRWTKERLTQAVQRVEAALKQMNEAGVDSTQTRQKMMQAFKERTGVSFNQAKTDSQKKDSPANRDEKKKEIMTPGKVPLELKNEQSTPGDKKPGSMQSDRITEAVRRQNQQLKSLQDQVQELQGRLDRQQQLLARVLNSNPPGARNSPQPPQFGSRPLPSQPGQPQQPFGPGPDRWMPNQPGTDRPNPSLFWAPVPVPAGPGRGENSDPATRQRLGAGVQPPMPNSGPAAPPKRPRPDATNQQILRDFQQQQDEMRRRSMDKPSTDGPRQADQNKLQQRSGRSPAKRDQPAGRTDSRPSQRPDRATDAATQKKAKAAQPTDRRPAPDKANPKRKGPAKAEQAKSKDRKSDTKTRAEKKTDDQNLKDKEANAKRSQANQKAKPKRPTRGPRSAESSAQETKSESGKAKAKNDRDEHIPTSLPLPRPGNAIPHSTATAPMLDDLQQELRSINQTLGKIKDEVSEVADHTNEGNRETKQSSSQLKGLMEKLIDAVKSLK